jgi:uncharacterized protein DUF6265
MSVRTTAAFLLVLSHTIAAQHPSPVVSGFPPSPSLRRVSPELAWLQRAAADSRTVTGIERAAWLQGCWESTTAIRTVEESWTTAKGGSMIGVGRTIRDGTMTAYEMIVLREQGDRLAYEAHPSGQASTTFLSTRISASELVFENPAHDFPQEVGYRRDGNSLLAWIRGMQNGQERRIEFPYTRARCGNQ